MLFASFVVVAFSGSAALPADLADMEKSVKAYREAVQKLDTESATSIAYATKVHHVAANATEREAVQKHLMDELTAKLPEAEACNKAEGEVEKAASALRKAESERAAAMHAVRAARAWTGENATAEEKAKHAELERAAAKSSADAEAARTELDDRVKDAQAKSAALRRASVEQADKIERDAHTLMHAAREHESAAKKAMRGAIHEGEEQSARLMRHGNVSERVGERMEDQAEFWAEGHEHAIEHAGDQASDDLERIYAPVLQMAQKARDQAEDADRRRSEKYRAVTRSADRLMAVNPPESTQSTGAAFWVSGVAGVAVIVGLVVRRRPERSLAEPLLG
jgi:ElaB/YqjD/DUF883 family membrane-anchored ribosome-binding protein